MTSKAGKPCLECGTRFLGRSDKKFCSDQCRIAYNNKLNTDASNYVRNVINILRKNRRILMELNPKGKTKVSREKLTEKGFDFTYFTSIYTTREGAEYHFCFENGYLEVDKKFFLLVVRNTESKE